MSCPKTESFNHTAALALLNVRRNTDYKDKLAGKSLTFPGSSYFLALAKA
jgi:hypothetical protein